MHCLGINLLPFPAHEPIEKNFGGMGMRRVLEDHQMAAAAADIDTFLGYGKRRHRQTGFDEKARRNNK